MALVLTICYYFGDSTDTPRPLSPWDSAFISMSSPLSQLFIGLGIGLAGGLQVSADYLSYYDRSDGLGGYLRDFGARAFSESACCGHFIPDWPSWFVVSAALTLVELALLWFPKERERLSRILGAAALGFGVGVIAGKVALETEIDEQRHLWVPGEIGSPAEFS